MFPEKKDEWTPKEQSLIAWFEGLSAEEFPKVPFALTGYITVYNEKFFDVIRESIKLGPNCPASRFGCLESKLEKLSIYMGKRD